MRRIVGPLLVAGLIGCDSATAPDTSYVGSYTLTSINGGAQVHVQWKVYAEFEPIHAG